jgi:predicted MPP superfamily phosphohydrolase
MDILRFAVFFLVSSSILIAAHFYIGKRLINKLNIAPQIKKIIWILLFLFPLFTPASFIFRAVNTPGFLSDIIGWLAYLEMGFFSLLIIMVFFRDILLLLNGIRQKFASANKFDPERRAFMLNSVNYSIIGTSVLLTGYGFFEARRIPRTEQIRIFLPGLPAEFEGYRIVQFSDLHVGPTIKRQFVQDVVNQILNLDADAIVFTGDLVDGSVAQLRHDVAPLAELRAPDGVYFVTGNHEYYSGALDWIAEADRLGMRVLLDGHEIISRENKILVMAGVTDFSAPGMIPAHVSDPHKALSGAPGSAVKILLAHQPRNIYEAAKAGFDLQISGHTHGGQYYPWRYVVTFSQPYVSGLHLHENTWIYVNRGTGYWGPPVRIGVPSEITVLTLTAHEQTKNLL